jgi:tartrate dehydratase beta subunit/fumarate hydratase class I family protein
MLNLPFTEEKIRALKVGEEVLISGVVFTGRGAGQ